MKKKLLTFILMLCLVLPVAIFFTACGCSNISYTATLESDELYFGNSKENKTANSDTGEVSLRGPAYYDYSEIKVLADGVKIDGLFTLADIYYDNNDVYIGTFNPKKLTANATITVTGIKDRIAHFTYMDFEDTIDYKDLKERYEGYLNTYTINSAKANNHYYSDQERQSARWAADSAKSSIDNEFDGNMNGFNSWYASKSAFTIYYELKLSEKDKTALTTAPLKDKTLSNSTTTYGSLVSEDGYIGIRYLSKIKNENESAYQFEYTYKELTTFDQYGYSMGMLPIRSLLPLGRDTSATRNSSNGSDRDATLHFNRISLIGYDDEDQAVHGKENNYDREDVLSVDVYGNSYTNHVTLGDDYSHKLYVKIYNLKSYATYSIDPTDVKCSKFSVMTANQNFNGFTKLNATYFVVKNMGDYVYPIEQLGQLYIFTDENGNAGVVNEKIILYSITVDSNEFAFHGLLRFDNESDSSPVRDELNSILYYDKINNSITNMAEWYEENENYKPITRSMVTDLTDEANVSVTVNDIEYCYEVSTSAGASEEFDASKSFYVFDMLLDSDHNIDWTNAKVKVGGYASNLPVNLVELKGDYGSYEIKELKIYNQGTVKTVKVLHCMLNMYKGGSMVNIETADDVYYPIHFVNKTDLTGSFGVGREAYTTYFIQVEGADFSNVTGMVKIKGTSNVNADAFENYENSNMGVFKNTDGTAYTFVHNPESWNTDFTGSYFGIYGHNFQDFSNMGNGQYYVHQLSSMAINIKKNGTNIKSINVKNYLTENYKYNSGDPSSISLGGNSGYYFTETDGDYKYHVNIRTEESMDGQSNNMVDYISSIIIIVEDISGTSPSENLQGFFEFEVNLYR